MSSDKDLVSIAQQFIGLPMESLIAGPLTAAVQANGEMARLQTRFLMSTCFIDDTANNGKYKPIMIKMEITRGVIEIKENQKPEISSVTTVFELPLLTIIPLNSLGVDEIDVSFEMEVKSSYSNESVLKNESKFHTSSESTFKFDYWVSSGSFSAKTSYDTSNSSEFKTHYKKENSAKYKVKVHASQLPLPSGVTTIIEAFTKAIEPLTVEAKSTPPETKTE